MKRKESSTDNNNKKHHSEVMECETLENPKKKIQKQDPIQKEQKYDRQLRLWGNDGQTALENARICLINATATATETLKCLVLPGIGKFYIVDDQLVNDDDLSSNFFVDPESIGKPRAKVACELLQELNPDTSGNWIKENAANLLDNDPEFYRKFTAVICSRVSEHDLLKLSHYFWEHDIPLFIVDSVGMFGYLRLVYKEHVIIKAHPDNTHSDLRLDCPFPELVDYFNKMDLSTMDNLEHSHTPFLVVLYKALERWQEQTGQKWPKNYKEKCQIKEIVRSLILKNEDGVPVQEENFEEALTNVNNVFSGTFVPFDVRNVLDNPMADHPLQSANNSKFWILVRALKEFVNQSGTLPLRGSLPDMFSDSKRYIELQNVYKTKAESDIQKVTDLVRESLEDLQRPLSFIQPDEIQTFCKNAAFIQVQYGLSYHDEIRQNLAEHKIKDTLEQYQENGASLYLAFRTLHSSLDQQAPKDLISLSSVTENVMKSCLLEEFESPLKFLEEMLRSDLSEIHPMAAVMGGISAQEVIKMITGQFVPVNNVLLVNSVESQTVTMKL